jgi:hypothetical protein
MAYSLTPIVGPIQRLASLSGASMVHYLTDILCRVSQTLGNDLFTFGKAFVECYTQQIFYRQMILCRILFRTLGKEKHSVN